MAEPGQRIRSCDASQRELAAAPVAREEQRPDRKPFFQRCPPCVVQLEVADLEVAMPVDRRLVQVREMAAQQPPAPALDARRVGTGQTRQLLCSSGA